MTAPATEPDAVPPFSPAVFHVLGSLADGDRRGYATIKDIEDDADTPRR